MSIENYHVEWARPSALANPSFVSDSIVCFPSDLSLTFCDVEGKLFRNSACPVRHIECVAALPTRGVLAVSSGQAVHVLSYPDLRIVSTLARAGCRALRFVGHELLATAGSGTVDFWEWSSRRRACSQPSTLPPEELGAFELTANLARWSEVCLQSSARILLLNAQKLEAEYHLKTKSVFLKRVDSDAFAAVCRQGDSAEVEPDSLSLMCHCWLPEDRVLVATEAGLLQLDTATLQVSLLKPCESEKSVIVSMALNREALFVGYKEGCVDIIDIARGQWISLGTVDVGQPIRDLSLSPCFTTLLVTTRRGSIFSHRGGSLHEMFRAETSEVVGVCLVGAMSRFCVVARKNGSLTVLRTVTGETLSSLRLEEELSSIAASPLCSLIVTGSSNGFLHFVDVNRPRVVHCTRTYEVAVEIVKFDNFGRLIVTASQAHPVHIYSGLPSSRLQLLGAIEVQQKVKDVAVFSESDGGDTRLVLLSESGPSSENGAGNLLVRVTLPSDFLSCPQKYHVDVFQSLSRDALDFQTFRLSHPCAKLDVHSSLGVLFHSPIVGKVQRLTIDFEPHQKQINLFKAEEASLLHVSSGQRWLACVGSSGNIHVYFTSDLKTRIISQKPLFVDDARHHFLEFSVWDDSFTTGDELGNVACFKWCNKLPATKIITEWLFFCHCNATREDEQLGRMEEEESLDHALCDSSVSVNSLLLEELRYKFDKYIDFMNYKLMRLPFMEEGSSLGDDRCVLGDESLHFLSNHNHQNFLACGGSDENAAAGNDDMSIETKVVSSNSGIVVQNYSGFQQLTGDGSFISRASEETLQDGHLCFYQKGIKIENEEERFTVVRDIRTAIRNWKIKFNTTFHVLHNQKGGLKDHTSEIYHRMKVLTSALPSKGERDLWSALYQNEGQSLSASESSETTKEETSMEDENHVSNTKNAIQSLSESVERIKTNFDLGVECLSLKKLLCNFVIHTYELKIFCILLYTSTEKGITAFKNEIHHELKTLNTVEGGFESILEETQALEKSYSHLFTRIQNFERVSDCKVRTKINKFGERAEEIYRSYKVQPDFRQGSDSYCPFWVSSPNLRDELAFLEQRDATATTTFPCSNMNVMWKRIYKYRTKRIKAEIMLRHVQSKTVELTKLRVQCTESKMKLEVKRERFTQMLDDLTKLLAKLKEVVHVLLTVDLLNVVERIDSGKGIAIFDEIPSPSDPLWEGIRTRIINNIRLQRRLLDVEDLLRNLMDLRVELISRLGELGGVEGLRVRLQVMKEAYLDSKATIGYSLSW